MVARKEVLAGRAKFGIFGDGKELPQVAMARSVRKGDWRSGYYRDQTLMFALDLLNPRQYFAQLYADPDISRDPQSGGRSMNGHFATRFLDGDGGWKDQLAAVNSAADASPTATQMPRAVGLAYASVVYRRLAEAGVLSGDGYSDEGNEVAWTTIGNASTAEGPFWESVNAIGVLGAPAVVAVYDDGYGISVPNSFQMVKENISAALAGFRRVTCPEEGCDKGFDLYAVPCWDYPALRTAFSAAAENARREHRPALVHVVDCTQPLGHSTSGSQERYKSAERLEWEKETDCIPRFRAWIEERGLADAETLSRIDAEEVAFVEDERRAAYEAKRKPIDEERRSMVALISALGADREVSPEAAEAIAAVATELEATESADRRDLAAAAHRALELSARAAQPAASRGGLSEYLRALKAEGERRYGTHLYAEGADSALRVEAVAPAYAADSPEVAGFELINAAFDAAFARDPRIIAFGEDLGSLGDVNQGFRGLQERYGPYRVTDTGIREATILGQAIGMAMRGLRPIAEIQYLDYLLYALQILSDDLSTLRWRSAGGQKAPVILRTRGHRLEGIWHSGSPMAGILNLVRGCYLLVPRDFTRAAGFYNTLLKAEESAVVVEVLNGYRRKEILPSNLGELTVPLGVCEILRPGKDLTLVSYGATLRPALDAAERLSALGAEIEVIDVQTLLPFDLRGTIAGSLRRTGRALFVDEDVPGGATAYMMREVLDKQNGYYLLDSPPRCLSAAEHRSAYGSDGDYWSKPNAESIFDAAYGILREAAPAKFPSLY